MRERPAPTLDWQPALQLSPEQLDRAWAAMRLTGGTDDRNLLIEHYLPTAWRQATWIHSRLPGEVQVDDVMSAAVDGLSRAIESFDPARGVKFETYAATRIRGAVLDALRRCDWVPRLVRSRANRLARCREQLRQELGRAPSQEEVADRLGVSPRRLRKILRETGLARVLSLDHAAWDEGDGRGANEVDLLPDPAAETVSDRLQSEDLKELVTRGLNRTERLVLMLYYFEEMTMKEIGAVLDISESRVSQIRSSVLARLRTRLRGRRMEFLPLEV